MWGFIGAQTAYPFAFAYAEEAIEGDQIGTALDEASSTDDDEDQEDEEEPEDVSDESADEDGAEDESVSVDAAIDSSGEEDAVEETVADSSDMDMEDEEDSEEGEILQNDAPETATSSEVITLTHAAESATSTSTTTESAGSSQQADTSATSSSSTPSSSQTTTIVSGQSIALANILNMVNSNFVNSEGVVLFSNFFENVFGAIDFRQYFQSLSGMGCSLISCQGQNVTVNVNDNASIDNEVVITANSGQNTIADSDNGVIETGDAYAGLNLINVANTNLIDSNYLLVTLNAFQDVNGDVVFPSLSQFFSSLSSGASTPEVIDIHNSGAITNDVNVDANAGDNTTDASNASTINTGNAHSSTNVFNQINSSLIGGQSVSVVFRVHGSWAGEIFGAPDNLAWTAGDDGSIYLFDVGGTSSNGSVSMHGTSTASINNDVNVIALTGENAITNAETAVISTGNAYAGANIINVANANVIGRNWILAVINIFGDFNGNIAFGRPDLWVGGQIDVPRSVENGSELEYTFTVLNNGDSEATNVQFETEINGDYLDIESASHAYEETGEGLQWDLGTIPAGGAVEVNYAARVQNTDPGTDIVNTARVDQRETDNNTVDNTEVLTISTDERRGNGIKLELGKSKSAEETPAEEVQGDVSLEIERSTQNVTVQASNSTVEQKLIVRNTSENSAKNVVLHDLLVGPDGTEVRDEMWELGDVLPHEEIELGYVIRFNNAAPFGTYTLHTRIDGENTELATASNGTIVYEALAVPISPLLTSVADTTNLPFSTAQSEDVSSAVFVGDETPLLPPPFSAPIAQAQEQNSQLAAALGSGFVFDPIVAFFVIVSGVLAFSLVRLFRW